VDDQKNKILIAVVAFNIVVMVYMIYRVIASGSDGLSFFDFVIAVTVAGLVAGGTFAVTMMKK
jgi:hypothetical protein